MDSIKGLFAPTPSIGSKRKAETPAPPTEVMPPPTHTPKRVKSNNRSLFDYSVRLVCTNGDTFDIHHGLLCAHSPVLAAKLKDDSAIELKLDDTDAEVFDYIKEYLYTGKLPTVDRTAPKASVSTQKPRKQITREGLGIFQLTGKLVDVSQLDENTMTDDVTEHEADISSSSITVVEMPEIPSLSSLVLTKIYIAARSFEMDKLAAEAMKTLVTQLDQDDQLPIDAIKYIYGESQHGGKVEETGMIHEVLTDYVARHAQDAQVFEMLGHLPKIALEDIANHLFGLRQEGLASWEDHAVSVGYVKDDAALSPTDSERSIKTSPAL